MTVVAIDTLKEVNYIMYFKLQTCEGQYCSSHHIFRMSCTHTDDISIVQIAAAIAGSIGCTERNSAFRFDGFYNGRFAIGWDSDPFVW